MMSAKLMTEFSRSVRVKIKFGGKSDQLTASFFTLYFFIGELIQDFLAEKRPASINSMVV